MPPARDSFAPCISSSDNGSRSIAGRSARARWLWYIGAVLLLSGVVGVGRGAWSLITVGEAGYLGTGIIALLIAPLLLIVPILRWRQTVEVFERGLVHQRLLGTAIIRREEVRSVQWIRHTSRQGSHDEVDIALASGRSHSMVGIDAPEQLCNFVRAWTQAPVAQAPVGWQPPPQGGWQPPPPQAPPQQPPPQGGWTPGGWRPPGS